MLGGSGEIFITTNSSLLVFMLKLSDIYNHKSQCATEFH